MPRHCLTIAVLLALASRAAAERVEAVLLLHDDDHHTFAEVCSALENLGIAPPQALLITNEVHASGVGLVSKGSVADLDEARGVLNATGLAAQTLTTRQVDREVRRSAKHAALRTLHGTLRNNSFARCNLWALAGACAREPLFMLTSCAQSCRELTPLFQQAARHRPPTEWLLLAPQLLAVLALAFAASEGALRLAGDEKTARAQGRVRAVATWLLLAHFLISGARSLIGYAGGGSAEELEAGWRIDDSEVVLSLDDASLDGGGGGGGGEEAAAHEAASTLATSVVTLATMLSRAPPALPALLGAVELGAAAVALTGRQLRVCGVLLFVVAAMGASHVVLSAAYMKVMGAGVHLSEVMAKKLSLVGGVALWLAHVGFRDKDDAPLPLSVAKPTAADAQHASQQGALLAVGRLLIALLLAAVGATELWRLLGTPFTSFDHGDGHDDLRLRLPQLLLSLPLAVGAATARVAGALAVLMVAEALLVWQWWQLAVFSYAGAQRDTAIEHFTVNLAVAGALLLLPTFGGGRYTLDQIVKKQE